MIITDIKKIEKFASIALECAGNIGCSFTERKIENLNLENRRAQYGGGSGRNRAIDATLIKRRKNNKRSNVPHLAGLIAVYK